MAVTALGRDAELAWAWAPWLAAIVVLDDLRVLQRVVGPAHVGDAVAAERWLFGGAVPVVELQRHLASAGELRVHDVVVALVYLLHSPAPLLCGAVLWRWRRALFRPFVASMLLCAAAGLVVYLAFPQAPPWLAAEQGALPPVRRITSEVVAHLGPLSSVYGGADPLPNAAMPSLHIAYPVLVAFWTIAAFGRRAAAVALYPAVLCVGVVYLGEHYAIDVGAGVLLADAAIAAVWWWMRPVARPATMSD